MPNVFRCTWWFSLVVVVEILGKRESLHDHCEVVYFDELGCAGCLCSQSVNDMYMQHENVFRLICVGVRVKGGKN